MIEILKALLLGIVEGITEFLPVSSTGHLIVVEKAIRFNDVNELFTVVIQVGAIAAVVWYFRKDLWSKLVGLFQKQSEAINFWIILVIGTIPASIFGLLLDKYLEKITQPFYVASALIIGGIILWLVDNKPVGRERGLKNLDQITKKQAIVAGLGQAVAIFPGVSRSGASIVGGLLAGLSRKTATAFSFYLAIPVMVMASGLKIVKYADEIPQVSGGWPAIIVGTITSFIVALMAIKWLLGYISRHNFRGFAIYRIVIGFFILFLIAAGVLV